MSIVKPVDFFGDRNIANVDNVAVSGNVQDFIDKYEPKFLATLLGSALYAELTTGLTLIPVEPATDPVTYEPLDVIWTDLATLLKPAIINYVYYWYMRNQATQTVGQGESKPSSENATRVSSSFKQKKAWNEMVGFCRVFDLDSAIYPLWIKIFPYGYRPYRYNVPDIYEIINDLNI